MNLDQYLNQQPRGGLVALANAIGAHVPDVSRWASGERTAPAHHAVAIERVTNGAVTRRDLRPKDWHLIWPDLSKRKRKPTPATEA